ncbi:TPA: AlpA family transcriptional regulator [Pseudomonas aeruginosa]|uniref:AlpA family transcriptional regulator n=1 Tax=Pseudomonas aeruginosa TaxID=287 RepID=UPI0018C51E07|nr:AlpA family transcriptional regulator [Pseudomonas aeruginosa]MBG4707843.1 AlpA family transcriptional regulator [Pseudomonas aeruginosa]MBI8516373.1 AlpA family transcriptional regulator [Pseudomonas aeruginosa]MCO3336210.1 AlpA family phage regulatory protein [Pseudomonas aeruginosa]HCL3285750.1 AlpA family transcriptional regulator [Pseudomonas aeruginosa]HEJ3143573.1 AlpA family transcriptional regulator [Pseudomonas aeruginosa]
MESNFIDGQAQRRILRRPEVEMRTGFKRAHIYNLMSRGLFPRAVPIGSRAVGWDSLAIERWVEGRLAGKPSHLSDSAGGFL